MSEQRHGGGGGIESGHFSAHTRNKSIENETLTAEAAVETRTSPPEPERQTILPGQSQQPLAPRRLSTNTPTPAPSSSSSTDRRQSRPQKLEPPVTKATLSELDVNKIIHNPKLRHDINYDPELHFRPNFDGEKGRRKQEKANQFWRALSEQLQLFVLDPEAFRDHFGHNGEWCLPLLLKSVREIIQTLVPQKDREVLDEGLNVELLMQQFNRGVADLEKLASWLSAILKRHCAPMRDEWVDEMYNELSRGNRNNDIAELVKGMRTLLSILEAMKLDVANHQIRSLRPVLIEDTVHFEQRFFIKKVQGGRISIDAARAWYQRAQDTAAQESLDRPLVCSLSFGETAVFFGALSKLVLPSTPVESSSSGAQQNTLPNTFLFDEDRFMKLRSDMHDSICLEICMRQYEELEAMARFPVIVPFGEFDHGAAAQTSRPSSFVWSDSGSTNPSPRNSGCLFGLPTGDSVEPSPRTRGLYTSLLALLHTAPPAPRPAQRWHGLSQAMALQILRYVNVPHITSSEFEEHLKRKLGNLEGDAFREVEESFHKRLLSELATRVKEYKNLSGVGLFSHATGGRINAPGRTWDSGRDKGRRGRDVLDSNGSVREPRDDGGVEDMATRMAHLGILHWRVWAPLVYTGDIQGGCEMTTGSV
ncbi:T-complex 11 [Phialemonium atrogriseum]|uniref:T-complex 11 n=1 Tax=Phialemonium atrogriseum TaxID=1093897 RepID=A0AAJ0C0P4_9PEZI|nr:T-complex 11 [Phialemonium atrogriseum]KAK1765531.1 T-complex 11 [Phialemonium atrogriseum]